MKRIICALSILGLVVSMNPYVSSAEEGEVIKLPSAQMDGGMPLMQALKLRKSTRGDFGPDTKLSMQQISNLLWAADGVNRDGGYRTAPSAANWNNIDIYVTTADGYYLYDPIGHALKVLGKEDIRSVSGSQPFVNQAPVNLIYVADFEKAVFGGQRMKDVEEAWSYANTGLIAQNVYLFAASQDLAAWFHNCDKENTAKEFNLRPEQRVLFAQTVGYPVE